ncbi:uncharacterized protein STEHIDRAFT_162501 [Stereum hirsutum FP-91666 SS1]|uniref:uncharacterized protein n=1 Tax=Stereum hirsutum (strain FP-91666) TaxID=721885 RepID=UPI0004449C9F|nr:uncharacterized protein STEHIDRAFT_162501 [Stereum hirsutum FP-91666 SS1]EIM80727.1 hypothetical protein STEHIDRAFT_162501 [Stereum hirsutum FP-91666 SS1]
MASNTQTPANVMHGAARNGIKDTPRENIQWHRDLTEDDLLRLAGKAGKKAGVCMISLDNEYKTLAVAHLISREKRREENEIQRIEYICGFAPGEFCVHSSSNLIYLRIDYHQLLDQGGWIMLPPLGIMESIERYYINKCKKAREGREEPDFTNRYADTNLKKNHKYRIVPLGALSFNDTAIRPSGKAHRNLLELPEVSSWVHPLYALWHAGGCIDRLELWALKLVISRLSIQDVQLIQVALRIWSVWQSITLPERFKPDFKPAKDDKRADPDNIGAPSHAGQQVSADDGEDADNNGHNSGEAGACADGNKAGNNIGNNNVHDHPHTTRSKTGSIKPKPKPTPSTTSKNAKKRGQEPGPSTDCPTGRRTDTADTCDEGHPEDTNYNNTGYSSHIKRTQTSSTRGKSKAAPSTTASKDMKNTTSKPAPDRSRRGQRAERGSSRRGRSGQRSDLEAGPSSTRRASVAESEQSAAKSTASKPRAKSGTA